jgi:hypothetical protein
VVDERRIWSIDRPSSRTWMRTVCVPVATNRTSGPITPTPQPLSCHPHPESPQPLQSSRFTSALLVVPVRQIGAPDESRCRRTARTESFAHALFCALPRARMIRDTGVSSNVISNSSPERPATA